MDFRVQAVLILLGGVCVSVRVVPESLGITECSRVG